MIDEAEEQRLIPIEPGLYYAWPPELPPVTVEIVKGLGGKPLYISNVFQVLPHFYLKWQKVGTGPLRARKAATDGAES